MRGGTSANLHLVMQEPYVSAAAFHCASHEDHCYSTPQPSKSFRAKVNRLKNLRFRSDHWSPRLELRKLDIRTSSDPAFTPKVCVPFAIARLHASKIHESSLRESIIMKHMRKRLAFWWRKQPGRILAVTTG